MQKWAEFQGNSTPSIDSEKTAAVIEFENQFNETLDEHYRSLNKSVKKEWTKDYVQNIIQEVKSSESAGIVQKKSTSGYYHASNDDIVEIAQEEVLIYKLKQHNDLIIRIVPRRAYFEKLMIIHR